MQNKMNNRDYLILSRKILELYFENKAFDKVSLLEHYPELKKHTATFITLTKNSQLRGCIGSLIAHKALLEDIEHNTLNAALRDPRFSPLAEEELS